jgi:hypothetical protein
MKDKNLSVDSILDDLDTSRLENENDIPSEVDLENDLLSGWLFVEVNVMQEERNLKEHEPENFYENMGLTK